MEYVVGGARLNIWQYVVLPVEETIYWNGGVELGARGLFILGTPFISWQAVTHKD